MAGGRAGSLGERRRAIFGAKVLRGLSILFGLLAAAVWLLWVVVRQNEMQPRAGPSPIPDLNLLFMAVAIGLWAVALAFGFAWHRRVRRTGFGLGVAGAAVVSVFALLGPADRLLFEWRTARIETLSQDGVDGFATLPQTVEAFEAERNRFQSMMRDITYRDLDGPGWEARVRYHRFHSLYATIVLGDAQQLEWMTGPPMQPECSLFPARFSQVYDPAQHADRYEQVCGPLGG